MKKNMKKKMKENETQKGKENFTVKEQKVWATPTVRLKPNHLSPAPPSTSTIWVWQSGKLSS